MKTFLRIALLSLCVLTACMPPTANELQVVQNAPRPSSDKAAHRAAMKFIGTMLIDENSALYRFQPLIRGSMVTPRIRDFGWFLCGKVNSRNRMGGYSGYTSFFVHFDPTTRDVVDGGYLTDYSTTTDVAGALCERITPQ